MDDFVCCLQDRGLPAGDEMDDAQLMADFENCRISREQWTHRAHVRVGFLYLRDYPFCVALEKMRTGIQRLNRHNDVPEGPQEGYNETTTHGFLVLIAATMQAYGDALPTPDSDSFCDTHSQLLSRNVLRLFYSPTRRLHPEAKCRFIEPDLATLPNFSPAGPNQPTES